jgi:hypothetical protein
MPHEPTGRPPGRPRQQPIPDNPDAKVKVSMDLKASGVNWLDDYAKATDRSRADVIREALQEYIARHGRPATPAPKAAGSPPHLKTRRAALGSRPVRGKVAAPPGDGAPTTS